MRRRVLLAVVVAAMAAALTVGLSQAPASTVPQQEQTDAYCQGVEEDAQLRIAGSAVLAQTFTALNTGRLTSVEVPVRDFSNTGSLVMEIRTVDASGVPTQTVLASTSIPASEISDGVYEFVFFYTPPRSWPKVVAGQQYALVLRAPEGGFDWRGSSVNRCPDGQAYESRNGGEPSPITDFDLFFKAFVTRCTIEGTRRGDTLMGTPGPDVICGFGGGDVLIGKGGGDVLIGDGGRDVLKGGGGEDALNTVDGVRGNDTANGGRGNDACTTDRRDERKSC